MDKILAENKEEFEFLERGYKKLNENFHIGRSTDLIVMKGLSYKNNRECIYVLPMNSIGKITKVSKISKDLEWALLSGGKGQWEVESPNYDYVLKEEVMENITNF